MHHNLPVALLFATALVFPSSAMADGVKVQVAPSVRVEGKPVLTIAPISGEGMPNEFAISGSEAYEMLRTEAQRLRPGARLFSLDTGMHALSPEGESSRWIASFLTNGELLTLNYEDGEVAEPYLRTVHPERAFALPDEEFVGYDIKKLYTETVGYAKDVVDPITRVTASLYRSFGSGKALWMLNVYNDDDRIGQSVIFEAKTMKFSHKTK